MKAQNFFFQTFFFALCFSFPALSQNLNDKDSILIYTQQLLDGIATSDKSAWNNYPDDSFIITSENGSVKTKQEFVKALPEPPSFMKVKETISKPVFRVYENTIVFSYTANLLVEIYGQQRLNEICQTDTWLKTNNGWKLIATEALDKPNAPSTQKISQNIINAVIGEYDLSKAYGFKIFEKGGKLYRQRIGGKEEELKCESDYVFFPEGNLLLKIIFVHDENGNVTQLISRRAGSDIIFPKII